MIFFCTGPLHIIIIFIDFRYLEYVLTAAHCCSGFSAEAITVQVGDWNRQANDVGEFTVRPTRMWIHENYGDINGISSDICLLKIPDLNSAMPDSCTDAVNGG